MRILDPGHSYELRELDGTNGTQLLRFVKRCGEKYPGNGTTPYPGVQMQEILRALIDRLKYVRAQSVELSDNDSIVTDDRCIDYLRATLLELELRAARRHKRVLRKEGHIEDMPTCDGCGHVGCTGGCR